MWHGCCSCMVVVVVVVVAVVVEVGSRQEKVGSKK